MAQQQDKMAITVNTVRFEIPMQFDHHDLELAKQSITAKFPDWTSLVVVIVRDQPATLQDLKEESTKWSMGQKRAEG